MKTYQIGDKVRIIMENLTGVITAIHFNSTVPGLFLYTVRHDSNSYSFLYSLEELAEIA
jgi:hypothetical protein